ncbi:cytidylate kinase [Mycoplasmopsis maculosa]|uniref:Cytidylate kinase n=1 Tax=Mycoplasmopsis maculosa TaxID=114885 RepID=A0A449B4D1_9BACT|nr:(d)CMP kinase [Mycoplasmopsis maculosa]VEU75425.1 cytidylate kinase [Mycoplasmopsis maculosa]
MKRINIAIDGPSGAGKSTVSKEIARKLGYTFINSGSVYRALALNAVRLGVDLDDQEAVFNSLDKSDIFINSNEEVFLHQENVSVEIREDLISKAASKIAQYDGVRQWVVKFIRHITVKDKGYIMDGRDTTFRLMPNAELKIFLNADPKERAMRRYKQNLEQGFESEYEIILKEVIARDYQDTHRSTDPLHKVEDAIEIDCTNMTFEEVVDYIILLAGERAK